MKYLGVGRDSLQMGGRHSEEAVMGGVRDPLQMGGGLSPKQVLRSHHAMWVLDFGQNQMINNTRVNYPGWRNLSSNPGFELVDRHGDASLYRVVACG